MFSRKSSLILILFGFLCTQLVFAQDQAGKAHKIILKLDDLVVSNGQCACMPTLELLRNKKIKAGFGIIPSRCDGTVLTTLQPFLEATNNDGHKLLEIWHHGWDHKCPEFKGRGYEYQKSHFVLADEKIKDFLGIQMHTFGTPCNAGDSITNRVITENKEYKVFLFSNVVPTKENGVMYLHNRTNIEQGTGNISFSYFKENYEEKKHEYSDYMVLQAHPNGWNLEQLKEFENILDYLTSEGCEFVLPYEYSQL